MHNEDEKKLDAIYELKKEFLRDMEKKGIRVDSEEKKEKKSTVYKPDVEIETVNMQIDKIETWFDIIINDSEVTDERLALFFENRLNGKSPVIYANQFGLMHMLRNDLDKAEKFFAQGKTVEAKFNLGVVKVFRNDQDTLDYAKNFLNTYPQNGYPYLLMSLFSLSKNMFGAAKKFLENGNKFFKHSFIEMAILLYEKNVSVANTYISKCYLENKAKKIVNMLIYISALFSDDSDKLLSSSAVLKNENNTCSDCFLMYYNKKISELPKYCRYGKKISYTFFENSNADISGFERSDTDFVKFYNLNYKDNANKEYDKLLTAFSEMDVLFFPGEIPTKGLKTTKFSVEKTKYKLRLNGPDYFTELRTIAMKLKENYNKEFDFMLDIPFYEVIRIVFGWRTCKRLY